MVSQRRPPTALAGATTPEIDRAAEDATSAPAPAQRAGIETLRRVRDGNGLLTAAAMRRLDEDLD